MEGRAMEMRIGLMVAMLYAARHPFLRYNEADGFPGALATMATLRGPHTPGAHSLTARRAH